MIIKIKKRDFEISEEYLERAIERTVLYKTESHRYYVNLKDNYIGTYEASSDTLVNSYCVEILELKTSLSYSDFFEIVAEQYDKNEITDEKYEELINDLIIKEKEHIIDKLKEKIEEIIYKTEYKTSLAQRKASQKYAAKNKEEQKIKSYMRTAKAYIKNYATDKDMQMFIDIYKERKKENKNGK